MKTTARFKSIAPDQTTAGKVIFLNPFQDNPYSRTHTRASICNTWAEENRIRAAELNIWRNELNSRE